MMQGIATLALLVLVASVAPIHGAPGKRLCYYTNWAQYRIADGRYTAADVDASLCDIVVYCFATMKDNLLKPLEWNDASMYKTMNAHKTSHPHLKTVISVGGANFEMAKMTGMLANKESRSQFIRSVKTFAETYNFNGIEFAFEHPGAVDKGSPVEDKMRFTSFVQELREAVATDFILIMATPAGKQYIDKCYDVKELDKYADYFSVRSFDYNGSWQRYLGINSPLFARAGQTGDALQFNVKWTMEHYVELGASKSKLIVGIPSYARGWTLFNVNDTKCGDLARGPSRAWTHTKAAGILAFYEICDAKNLYKDFTEMYQDEHKSPCATYSKDQWISYDDRANIKLKVKWIKEQGYGGFMFWTLDYDDFKNLYCTGLGKYPLLKAGSDAMLEE